MHEMIYIHTHIFSMRIKSHFEIDRFLPNWNQINLFRICTYICCSHSRKNGMRVCVCVYLCESKRNVCSFQHVQYFQNVLINKNIMFLFLDSFPIRDVFKFTVTCITYSIFISTTKFLCLSLRCDGARFSHSPNALQFSHLERKTIRIKRNGVRERGRK